MSSDAMVFGRQDAVTASDTVDLKAWTDEQRLTDAIYVGGTGAVVVVKENGLTVSYAGVPAGTVLPVRAKRVNSTGTAATGMVALYA